MGRLPNAKRKDEKARGEYRTKHPVLESCCDMAKAIATGEPYQARLPKPPADSPSSPDLPCAGAEGRTRN